MAAKSSSAVAFAVIGLVVAASGVAFAYTAGWLSPARLTPGKFIDALKPPSGEPFGHRRNHAKGICFTGIFDVNGNGVELSKAQVFAKGQYPVLGRFNLGTADPNAADATVRVRGLGLQIKTPDGREWRTAMIDPPFFAVSTPEAFLALLTASASEDPNAMPAFAAAHPEIAAFGAWAKSAPWTPSYAEDRFNGLNSFFFVNSAGKEQAVRWSLIPETTPTSIPPDELAKRGPNYLEQEIADRIGQGPVRWKMIVTLANPGDPTADPSRAWPDDRRSVEVGTLVAQKVIAEPEGPCRDINYDPTVLPDGIRTSDDPFPAARSAVYAKSFDKRASEARFYPEQKNGAK